MAVAKVEAGIGLPSFFGVCDRKGENPHGEIIHTNPMWTKKKAIADMENSIQEINKQEQSGGFIDPRARARKIARKKTLETKLAYIKASNPVGKVKGKALDAVKKAVGRFQEEVRDRNTTVWDDEQGMSKGRTRINPSKQGYMSKNPCIKLADENEFEIAKSCNMKIDKGMVSKDDMTRAIWMLQEILHEEPDHLALQREKPSGHIAKSSQVLVGDLPPDMVKQ